MLYSNWWNWLWHGSMTWRSSIHQSLHPHPSIHLSIPIHPSLSLAHRNPSPLLDLPHYSGCVPSTILHRRKGNERPHAEAAEEDGVHAAGEAGLLLRWRGRRRRLLPLQGLQARPRLHRPPGTDRALLLPFPPRLRSRTVYHSMDPVMNWKTHFEHSKDGK